jgi:UDP-N-acetylmuramyl tripeptide synthase
MIFIVISIKILTFFLRLLKFGGGTSLPGYLIEKYRPGLISKLFAKYEKVVLITGTNGKTTTQQLLRHLLESKGLKIVSNISGANLFRGIITALIYDLSFTGKPKSEIAVIEVEEATMPIITRYVQPDFLVVTSLYRDQLDAYGEIVQTREYILNSIKASKRSKLILNGDDENVSSMMNEVKNKAILFSIKDSRKKEIFFERTHFKLHPKSKRIKRVWAENIHIENDLSTVFEVSGLYNSKIELQFASPGLQNIYNALSASVVARKLGKMGNAQLRQGFSSFQPAFGRGEIIKIGDKNVRLMLMKNPASFTANLNMLKNINELKLMIIINDNIADGTDVSWLWDTKVEVLQDTNMGWITVSGMRARDMLLRLKYAGIELLSTEIEENISKALKLSLSKLKSGETLFVLPTYTAMLEVRKAIGSMVKIKNMWE